MSPLQLGCLASAPATPLKLATRLIFNCREKGKMSLTKKKETNKSQKKNQTVFKLSSGKARTIC